MPNKNVLLKIMKNAASKHFKINDGEWFFISLRANVWDKKFIFDVVVSVMEKHSSLQKLK